MITKLCRHCSKYVDDDHDEQACRIKQVHPDSACEDCGHWVTEPSSAHRAHCGRALDADQTRAAADAARAAIKNPPEESTDEAS